MFHGVCYNLFTYLQNKTKLQEDLHTSNLMLLIHNLKTLIPLL